MLEQAQLVIRLTPSALKPRAGQATVNCLSGGPETLLRWLETQLGLPVPVIHNASRITEYAAALDTVSESTIGASLKNDRWETASSYSQDGMNCSCRVGTRLIPMHYRTWCVISPVP